MTFLWISGTFSSRLEVLWPFYGSPYASHPGVVQKTLVCKTRQVTGLSCSALSRFPESMSQTGLLHVDAGRVLQAPNPLACSGTNRELSRADAANHLYDDGPP